MTSFSSTNVTVPPAPAGLAAAAGAAGFDSAAGLAASVGLAAAGALVAAGAAGLVSAGLPSAGLAGADGDGAQAASTIIALAPSARLTNARRLVIGSSLPGSPLNRS